MESRLVPSKDICGRDMLDVYGTDPNAADCNVILGGEGVKLEVRPDVEFGSCCEPRPSDDTGKVLGDASGVTSTVFSLGAVMLAFVTDVIRRQARAKDLVAFNAALLLGRDAA